MTVGDQGCPSHHGYHKSVALICQSQFVYFVRGVYSLLSTKMCYVKKIKKNTRFSNQDAAFLRECNNKKRELKYIYFERGNTGKQTINAGNPGSKFLKNGNRMKHAGLKGEKRLEIKKAGRLSASSK